jgi:hypothetical protein
MFVDWCLFDRAPRPNCTDNGFGLVPNREVRQGNYVLAAQRVLCERNLMPFAMGPCACVPGRR